MTKLFFDSDVILDLLLDREPFSDDIAEIMEESESKSVQICISSTTITNVNHIVGRIEGYKNAHIKTQKILQLVKVENEGESTIKKAIASNFKDFEDAVQNYCAAEAEHSTIITRNVKDFKTSDLSIMTPKEILTKMNTMQ